MVGREAHLIREMVVAALGLELVGGFGWMAGEGLEGACAGMH